MLLLCNKFKTKSKQYSRLLLNIPEIAALVKALLMNCTLKEDKKKNRRRNRLLSRWHKLLFSKFHSDHR